MKRHGFLLVLLLLLVCFGAESEIKGVDPKSRNEQNNTLTSKETLVVKPSGSKPVSVVDKKENVHGTDNLSKDLDSKEVPKVVTGKDDLSKKPHVKDGNKKEGVVTGKDDLSKKPHVKDGNKKEGTGDGSGSKMVPIGLTVEGNSVTTKPTKKEGVRGEECDSSSTCKDEINKLVACLRVPGDESPELSLLIQNKGTSLLSLKISAPDYVHLETNTVHLQQNEDKKVKVSIGKESKDTFIVLTAKDRNCSINFKDLIPHNSGKKTDHTAKSAFVDIVTKVPSIVFLSIAAVILVASSWMCVRFRSKHLTGEGTKYQKLETELPVTSAGKKETDVTGKKETDVVDGWDDSWGDSWDDEEAPRTPSMPITPSLSSKGLASRRLSKDAWKD